MSDKKAESLDDKLKKLEQENQMLTMNVEELTVTNTHLVSATWREREMKQELAATLAELTETKKIVDAQHKSITDSINYAQRIQHAIIPTDKEIASYFKESFVYFKAKDVLLEVTNNIEILGASILKKESNTYFYVCPECKHTHLFGFDN